MQLDRSSALSESNAAFTPGSPNPEEIRRLFAASSPEDWKRALELLRKLIDPKVKLELLKSASKVQDDWTMQQVIMELGLLGNPEAGEVLIQILKSDRKGWMKEQAAGWLGNTGGPGALEALLEAYHSDSFELQVVAAGSLYKQGYLSPLAEMLPKVGKLLESSDGSVRRDAVELLGHLAVSEALPLLTHALQDSNGDVRIQAIRVLRQGTIPGAVALIENMLGDSNPYVVKEANRALTALRESAKEGPK
jgi:HEAT repeat protein